MVLCKRRGCGTEFDATGGSKGPCTYHPGAPVFHEGLKSWSCCKETNKPVLEFEQFMKLPGCAMAEAHTDEAQPLPTPQKPAVSNEEERLSTTLNAVQLNKPAPIPPPTQGPPPPAPEPRDPDSLVHVPAGTACRRSGCNYVQKEALDTRDKTQETCRYHKGVPIFHEGSKGYTCCKRRVLHFDDFLQIEPCTKAEHGHLFEAPKPADNGRVECRMDHYETPGDVRVTVYAKGVEQSNSVIEIRENEVRMHLLTQVVLSLALGATPSIPHTRRFERTLQLYAPVNPSASTCTLGKMKLDLVLAKQTEGESWPTLERGERVFGYGLTFGRRTA